VYWPGRLEILSREPLVVVDCAHNPYSARTLRQTLAEWFPDQSWMLIFGASADKDIAGMLEALLPISDYTIVTRAEHPRATAPVTLADRRPGGRGGGDRRGREKITSTRFGDDGTGQRPAGHRIDLPGGQRARGVGASHRRPFARS